MATVFPSSKPPQQGGTIKNNVPTTAAPTTSKKPPKTTSTTVTPQHRNKEGVERHMAVDKNIVDELLLVCGVIGTTTETSSNGVETLVPVTDCLNWLQDLQRALRRDEDLYRPISLLLGKWNVVQKKLLPLVLTCRYDTPMVLTIVKILVILTKPLHENTQRAARLIIDTKSNKVPEEVIEEQKKLRENALAQSDMLMEYKKAIVHHPSHRKAKDDFTNKEGGLLSIFVSLLAEPLSKTGTKRTEADHLTIELVLHLFRNILSVEPIVKGSQETSLKGAQLHDECIALFERELVMEILLVICQEMELRENAPYNLLIMEIISHLLKSQDPTGVARSMMSSTNNNPVTAELATTTEKDKENNNKKESATKSGGSKNQSIQTAKPKSTTTQIAATSGLLRAHMQRDKQQFRSGAPARHGNFGGTLMLKRQDGKRQYVSASSMLDQRTQGSATAANLSGPKKRKNRKTEPFIGSGRTLLAHTKAGQTQTAHRSPAAIRAQKTLHRFCERFVEKCYGPVMKSLKNEFRRDSVRLEGDEDKVVLFRIIWFFFQWFRVSGFGKTLHQKVPEETGNGKDSEGNSALGQLIFTMDVFSFNLVLNATTTFTTHKQYKRLAQTVALYAEMMHMLHCMYHSKDSTEQIMALGLMDRLFYGAEPVDRLPKLLSSWTPSTTTREYVCDLVEACHVTLKLLDANKKSCADIMESEQAQQAMVKTKAKKKKLQTNDAVLQMKVAASDFDVMSYFLRKVVSNQSVFMYTKLLEQYAFNAPHVNHRIVSFFLRLAKVKVVEGEDIHEQQLTVDGSLPMKNLLAPKTATLEPMLYNMHMLMVLNKILNDPMIRNDKTYATTLSWAAGVIHNFATASATNPMLFVECLFKHPVPHRFCELSANMYVNEELRMIAERELLLEAQRLEALNEDQSDEEDEEPEEELEFVDMEQEEPTTSAEKHRKASSSSSSEDEDESQNPDTQKQPGKKRRLQLQTKAKVDEDESSEAELEFELTEGSSSNVVEAKSNTSRLKRKALDDSSDEEDLVEDNQKDPKPSPTTTTKKQKIRRKPDFEDSSDEEPEFNFTTKKAASTLKSGFDDSSDEEEGEKESMKSIQARREEARQNLRKAVLDDSSDDDDEGKDNADGSDNEEIVENKSASAATDGDNGDAEKHE